MDEIIRQLAVGYKGLNVLVTGADGFIGSHLAELLARCGANVTALSLYNSFDTHGWLDDLPAEVRDGLHAVRGDVRDAAFIHRLVAHQDIVFHLAALIAIPHSYAAAQSYVETNVLGTLNVLEAARAHGIMRVVHTSTSEVYGTALTTPIAETHPLQGQSPYSASKIGADMMAEAYARSFGLPVAILRPFNTFGPRQSERAVIGSILRQALDPRVPTIRVGDLSTIRDFTFVEDTAMAFLTIGNDPRVECGTPYNAGSGRAVTIAELADLTAEVTGSNKPIETEPQRVRPERSEVRELLADASRFAAATGWRPRISLREGLARTAQWWRGRLENGRVRRERDYVT
ncbi:SDR family NAD(P)-dependent oxidoreductase [Siccirubricoccus sp. G192]|uniref:SDR family NAD(P)-dependent oxidoreductase n=1 Tax=Siccirubricoccus sp. G192 TaxID=2849651 RepID=UPI001C2BC257|nr:SDR family NAD(P)-dependent oxidoreductase [Siccirubricoccus sp. G192]MBV1797538.1 SDR family NAD(P)-dependent oxidoreductase [Siccirubricoccus sp. G192]